MNFDEIPFRMAKLGVDRTWLAKQCDYSMSTLANALAPNGTNKTEKALRRIWEALDREEARQQSPVAPLEMHQLVMRPTDEQFDSWNREANAHGMLIKDWCIEALNAAAHELARHPIARIAEDPKDYGSDKEKK